MIRGVSFRLAPGECLGIIGPSGSGKSTLGKVIAGVCAPAAGSVQLDNADVVSVRDSAGWRLGYLPQDIDLFGETVRDIIARLDGADLRKVVAAAKLTGLHDSILRLPQAYDTVFVGGVSSLSRGFRQRLGLARAFYGDPHLVVLDEPNANLDAEGENALGRAIQLLRRAGSIVIVISHRPNVLAALDMAIVLYDGKAIAFGSSREVFARVRGSSSPVTQPATAPNSRIARRSVTAETVPS